MFANRYTYLTSMYTWCRNRFEIENIVENLNMIIALITVFLNHRQPYVFRPPRNLFLIYITTNLFLKPGLTLCLNHHQTCFCTTNNSLICLNYHQRYILKPPLTFTSFNNHNQPYLMMDFQNLSLVVGYVRVVRFFILWTDSKLNWIRISSLIYNGHWLLDYQKMQKNCWILCWVMEQYHLEISHHAISILYTTIHHLELFF